MTKFMPFQLDGIRDIHRFNGRVLLGDMMGLGKGVQTIGYIDALENLYPTVVICPAIVKNHWQDEWWKHAGVRARILEGQKPDRRLPLIMPKVIIINYDILQYWAKWIRKLKPRIVVLDEVQAIGNRSAIRTKASTYVCKGVKKVIGLSGTAMRIRPVELFPFLHICRPDKFPSFRAFAYRFCSPRRRRWGWEYKGATHVKELHNILKKNLLIRRRRKDVLKDLPEMSREVFPILLNKKEMREYNEAEQDFRKWMQKKRIGSHKIERALKAEAVVKMGYLIRLAAELKLPYVLEYVDQFLESTDEKIILFAIHRKILGSIKDHFEDKCVLIHGGTSRPHRKEYLNRFNKSKSTRMLAGQLYATNIGWNGTAATTVGQVELGWAPADHTQGDDRVNRIGQTKKTRSIYFVAKNTIEERLCEMLTERQKTSDSLLDGGKVTDFNLIDRLLSEFQK